MASNACGILVEAEGEVRKLSPRDAYIGFCLRRDCKPILAVADLFSGVAGDWTSTTAVDLSTTYVGPRGICAVCDVCTLLVRLRHVDFSDNFLTNECAPVLAELVAAHPFLESLELHGNRYMSWTAAMYLANAVAANSRMTYVGLLGTSVDAETRSAVFAATRRNALTRYAKQAGSLQPSNHRNAVLLRAMRHYFLSLAGDNDTVPASCVQDGRRERRLFQGDGADASNNNGAITLDANRQALESTPKGDTQTKIADEPITWSHFLILVMLDGTVYDEQLVRRLAHVFESFNVIPSAGLTGGLVEVSEFAHVLSTIYSLPPRHGDVAVLREKLGLDDTMTISWDEFLYTFYPSPSDMSGGVAGCVATPLPDDIRAFHY